MMGHKDVDQQTAGTTTLEPGARCFFLAGFVIVEKASRLAEEPEFVITAYGSLINLENSDSNSFTHGPIVSWPPSITEIAFRISLLS
jgi:hypothetical protein